MNATYRNTTYPSYCEMGHYPRQSLTGRAFRQNCLLKNLNTTNPSICNIIYWRPANIFSICKTRVGIISKLKPMSQTVYNLTPLLWHVSMRFKSQRTFLSESSSIWMVRMRLHATVIIRAQLRLAFVSEAMCLQFLARAATAHQPNRFSKILNNIRYFNCMTQRTTRISSVCQLLAVIIIPTSSNCRSEVTQLFRIAGFPTDWSCTGQSDFFLFGTDLKTDNTTFFLVCHFFGIALIN